MVTLGLGGVLKESLIGMDLGLKNTKIMGDISGCNGIMPSMDTHWRPVGALNMASPYLSGLDTFLVLRESGAHV